MRQKSLLDLRIALAQLVEVEYTFDNSKILFYFTADGRVDFRELVKDLAVYFARAFKAHAYYFHVFLLY